VNDVPAARWSCRSAVVGTSGLECGDDRQREEQPADTERRDQEDALPALRLRSDRVAPAGDGDHRAAAHRDAGEAEEGATAA